MVEFVRFPSIPRLSRDCIVTEKIDGTNACVIVSEDGSMCAASRNRLITPDSDNYGFAAWVRDHSEALQCLGVGRHFGEWFGRGIQRGYGLADRRFILFRRPLVLPTCCEVVPTLFTGVFDTAAIDATLRQLRLEGSRAAPGFVAPEGVVIYHTSSGLLFKKTFDDSPKSLQPLRI